MAFPSVAQYSRVVLFPAQLDSAELLDLRHDRLEFDPALLLQSVSEVGQGKKLEIIHFDNSYWAWEDCNLNMYQWTNDSWVNRYGYNNYGFFCEGYPVVWNGKLHLLGGNGLVNYHSDLLVFEKDLGSWEFSSTAFQPLDYRANVIGVDSTGVFALLGKKYNERTGLDKWEDGYFLDRSSTTWYGVEISWEKSEYAKWLDNRTGLSIDLDGFSLLELEKGWFILDKGDEVFHFLNKEYLQLSDLSFLGVAQNTLVWKSKGQPVMEVDLTELISESDKVAEIEIVPIQNGVSKTPWAYFLGVIFLFIGLIVFRSLRLNRQFDQKKKTEIEPQDVNLDYSGNSGLKYLTKLIDLDSQTFTTEQLDEFFGLEGVQAETRKARRARLIKNLNDQALLEFGQEIIFRERDPVDKRYFRFRINVKKP